MIRRVRVRRRVHLPLRLALALRLFAGGPRGEAFRGRGSDAFLARMDWSTLDPRSALDPWTA